MKTYCYCNEIIRMAVNYWYVSDPYYIMDGSLLAETI